MNSAQIRNLTNEEIIRFVSDSHTSSFMEKHLAERLEVSDRNESDRIKELEHEINMLNDEINALMTADDD